jgi:hypothetical protein
MHMGATPPLRQPTSLPRSQHVDNHRPSRDLIPPCSRHFGESPDPKKPRKSLFGGPVDEDDVEDRGHQVNDQVEVPPTSQTLGLGIREQLSSLNLEQAEAQDQEIEDTRAIDIVFGLELLNGTVCPLTLLDQGQKRVSRHLDRQRLSPKPTPPRSRHPDTHRRDASCSGNCPKPYP